METASSGVDPLEDAPANEPSERRSEEGPPGGTEQPNPFWSERASDEFRLQQARPLQLAEYDDRQAEPDYGSDTARSGGYASVLAHYWHRAFVQRARPLLEGVGHLRRLRPQFLDPVLHHCRRDRDHR